MDAENKGALVSTAVKSLVPKGCARYLVGYRDSATEWMVRYGTEGVYISKQPSCVGGKYALPLSGTDVRKRRSAMTPTNGRIHRQRNT